MAGVAFASDEWAEKFKEEINKSVSYKAAARGWKWTIGFVDHLRRRCEELRLHHHRVLLAMEAGHQ
ncbi:MAG: hypothetical protein E6J53_00075 [Chloroflexi bacterium]|nr:MAG: hypothetical protein E6J53_00075 [Chloroflexota bacterium]